MKFCDLEKGSLGGRTLDFEFPGRAVSIRVIPFLGGQNDAEIEAGAGAYVVAENKRRKAETPDAPLAVAQPKDPTYERGIYAHTVLRGVLDPEDGQRFFASVEEILDRDHGLDRDRLAMLFELQQQAQADFAPRGARLSNDRYFQWLEQTAEAGEGTDLPFESSPRATQRLYHRGIARSYRDLLRTHVATLQELASARSETELARSEISSLRGKSTPGPSSPVSATSSGSFAGSSPPGEGEAP